MNQQLSGETGREKAMRLFLDEYRYVEAFALRLAPNRSCCDDIVHDVFTTFVAKADQWDLDCPLRPLLAGITKKIALRAWQQHLKTLPEGIRDVYRYAFDLETGHPYVEPETDVQDLTEQLTALDICSKKLTDKCSELLHLYYVDKLSYKEIAVRTGQKPGALQKTMCRLRQALRTCIERILKTTVDLT